MSVCAFTELLEPLCQTGRHQTFTVMRRLPSAWQRSAGESEEEEDDDDDEVTGMQMADGEEDEAGGDSARWGCSMWVNRLRCVSGAACRAAYIYLYVV